MVQCAPLSLIRFLQGFYEKYSFLHSLTHSSIYSFIHPLVYSSIHPFTCTSTRSFIPFSSCLFYCYRVCCHEPGQPQSPHRNVTLPNRIRLLPPPLPLPPPSHITALISLLLIACWSLLQSRQSCVCPPQSVAPRVLSPWVIELFV